MVALGLILATLLSVVYALPLSLGVCSDATFSRPKQV